MLTENGTYHIIQITGIDPARPIDATTLKTLKGNVLTVWLLEQKALPGMKVGSIDQDKLVDPLNMPPGLPSSAPAATPPAGGVPGVPGGGVPGGVPGVPGGNPPGSGQ